MHNTIAIHADQEVSLDDLSGRYIYVENDRAENGVYRIYNAEKLENGDILLDIGDSTLICAYRDPHQPELGYQYNIGQGQNFRIPLSSSFDPGPVFEPVSDQLATAGKSYSISIHAESPAGKELQYQALSLPRGAQFDPDSATLTWNPDTNQLGKSYVLVQASDGALDVQMSFAIQVVKSASGGGAPSPSNPQENSQNPETPPSEEGEKVPGQEHETTEKPRFVDLEGYAWAEEAINDLAAQDIIRGTGPHFFSPGEKITRADFAILLTRAFQIQETGAEAFEDVPQDAYYAEELATARAGGIVAGIGGNRFQPLEPITRQDMMVMLARAMDKTGIDLAETDEALLAEYTDSAQIAPYARDAAARLIYAGIIAGADGKLNPMQYAIRAEVAVMLSRVLTNKL